MGARDTQDESGYQRMNGLKEDNRILHVQVEQESVGSGTYQGKGVFDGG